MSRAILRRSEKDEERAGDELMALYGFRSIHFSQARASNQTPGIPDRKYFNRARRLAVWWEAKADDGKQSKAQREFQLDCEACGEAYVLGPMSALSEWLVSLPSTPGRWEGEALTRGVFHWSP